MVEVSADVVGSANSSARFQNKQFINIIFILLVVLVVGGVGSVFYFTSAPDVLSSENLSSNSTSREQYYTGADEWYLDEVEVGEPSVKQIKNADSADLEDGFRTRMKEGGIVNLEVIGDEHEIFIDSVNGNSVDITIQSEPIFATINVGEQKKFDLDKDYVYDLKISLLEIVDGEGIFQVKGISEEYQPVVQTEDGPVTTPFARFSSVDVPYSCSEKDGSIYYSYLDTLMAGDKVYSENRINWVKTDLCIDGENAYRHFSCDGKNLVIETVSCDSRFESCKNAECVVTKYEKNIGKSGSPDEKLKGKLECLLKTADTIFWFDSEEESCKDIFVASNFLFKSSFLNLLSSSKIDVSVLKDSFIFPLVIEVYYINSDGVYNNFSDVESKFSSDVCESIDYLGLDTYCFNEISDFKDSNLKYIVNILTFLKLYSVDYSSSLFPETSNDFLKNIYYVDSSGYLRYSGIFSNFEVLFSCSDKLFNYEFSDNEFVFVCGSVFVDSALSINKANFSNNLFYEVLKSKDSGEEKCESGYVETGWYNITNLISSDEECLGYYELEEGSVEICNWTTSEEYNESCEIFEDCEYENETVVEGHDEFYVNFDSSFGDYMKYLFAMSDNQKLSCSFRQESWDEANGMIGECSGGVKDYISPSRPYC